MEWNYETINIVLNRIVEGKNFTSLDEKCNFLLKELKRTIPNFRLKKERMIPIFKGEFSHEIESTNFFEICVLGLINDNFVEKNTYLADFDSQLKDKKNGKRITTDFKKKYLDLYVDKYSFLFSTSQQTIPLILKKYLLQEDFVYLGVFYAEDYEKVNSEINMNYDWNKAKQLKISQKNIENYDTIAKQIVKNIIEIEEYLKEELQQGSLPRVILDVKSGAMYCYKLRGLCIIGITHFQSKVDLCDGKMKELTKEIGIYTGQLKDETS